MKVDSAFAAKFVQIDTLLKGTYFKCRVAAIGDVDAEAPILVIYLHGRSASGTDNEKQLAKFGVKCLYDYLTSRSVSSYLFVPQCPDNRRWNERETNGWQMTAVVKMALDNFVKTHNVNPKKIFIFGDSMGGAGIWRMLSDYSDYFAAAMIAASMPRKVSEKKIARTPLCCVIGSDDDIVTPDEINPVVESLRKKHGEVKYEILEGKTHPQTCHDAFTVENIEWVLSHTRQ